MANLSERWTKRALRIMRVKMSRARGHHSRWWRQGQQLLIHTKSEWGPGPWQDEPDRLEWRHASGLPCLIVRGFIGSLCGYVGVPPEHPLYMRDYADCELEAHGELTYSAHCQGKICHKPEPGEEKDIWWFGFDCAHFEDIVPSMRAISATLPAFARLDRDETYRSIEYVRAEVERLAEQVAGATHG